ncbi:peptide transporter PTR2, partial [Trifolium pratense]
GNVLMAADSRKRTLEALERTIHTYQYNTYGNFGLFSRAISQDNEDGPEYAQLSVTVDENLLTNNGEFSAERGGSIPGVLHEILQKGDAADVHFLHLLKRRLCEFIQNALRSTSFWEELNSHRPIPNCTCMHQCRCPALQLVRNYRLEVQVIQFLTGLGDQFSVVKTQLLLMDPLPSLNKVYSLAIQEEQSLSSTIVNDESSSLINAAYKPQFRDKGPSASSSKPNSKYCTFCHRNNHVVEFCYAKHGHPNQNRNGASVNASNTEEGEASNGNTEGGVSATVNNSISQEQFHQLVVLLQQVNLPPSASTSNPSSSVNQLSMAHGPSPNEPSSGIVSSLICSLNITSTFWLLDSVASEHICSSLQWFNSFYKIKPMHIKLPNGSSVIVQHAGNVTLSPTLSLTHVLYSPVFNLNLISVSKLCQSLDCLILFNGDNCALQDVKSKKMIGLGEHVDGLYKLPVNASFLASQASLNFSSAFINNVVDKHQTIPMSAIWHFRLGHVSNARLSNMIQMYPSITVDTQAVCDVCHFAKQRKLPFSLSNAIANSAFELLHCDIWGPLAIPSVHGHKFFLTIVDDYSRFVWILLVKSKAEVAIKLQNFIVMIENQFHTTPKTIRSDNGSEFMLTQFYSSKGIIHQDHADIKQDELVKTNTSISSSLQVT